MGDWGVPNFIRFLRRRPHRSGLLLTYSFVYFPSLKPTLPSQAYLFQREYIRLRRSRPVLFCPRADLSRIEEYKMT